MKTKTTNGARTPEVIREELKRYCKLEGVVSNSNSGLYYEYYTTPPELGESPAIEVTLTVKDNKAIATRKIDEAALNYFIPGRPSQDIKFGGF